MLRGADDGWVCPDCMTDWMGPKHKSVGGIELPDGVTDERRLTFTDILPNRRARRAVLSR